MPIARVRKTPTDTIQKLDQLLESCSDRQAAAELNSLGYRNWKGEPFTAKRARYVRIVYGLVSLHDRLRARGFLTAAEMARQLGVCREQVYHLGREGVLPQERYGNDERCLYAPLNGATYVQGRGGGYRSRAPTLIPTQSAKQEIV